jgi:hypothetical protein
MKRHTFVPEEGSVGVVADGVIGDPGRLVDRRLKTRLGEPLRIEPELIGRDGDDLGGGEEVGDGDDVGVVGSGKDLVVGDGKLGSELRSDGSQGRLL